MFLQTSGDSSAVQPQLTRIRCIQAVEEGFAALAEDERLALGRKMAGRRRYIYYVGLDPSGIMVLRPQEDSFWWVLGTYKKIKRPFGGPG